jgi:8-oxo-dGTP pyrophosphatase MutT (NUDIX family)
MAEQEKSAGVIIFRRENGTVRYVMLFKKYKIEYWDLPKGNIEKGEEPQTTAEREAAEETGITDLKFVPGFEEKLKWVYRLEGQLRFKTVTYFLAETQMKEVKVSYEHLKPGWFTLEEAEKVLKHKDTKELLRKAQQFLEKREKEGLGRFL